MSSQGSIPARTDGDRSLYDTYLQSAMDAFASDEIARNMDAVQRITTGVVASSEQAVAEGDYEQQLPQPGHNDELAFLVSSFNSMTRRIARGIKIIGHEVHKIKVPGSLVHFRMFDVAVRSSNGRGQFIVFPGNF